MAIILKEITLPNGVNINNPIMTTTAEVGYDGALISLRFWASFTAYKDKKNMLFDNQPIRIFIEKGTKTFEKCFSLPRILPAGKTPTINFIEYVLKGVNPDDLNAAPTPIDGTEESINLYTGQYIESQRIVVVDDQQTVQTIATPIVDIRLDALLGLDFTDFTDCITQQEFDLAINGIANPFNGKRIFNETTEQFETFSEGDWFIS